MYCKINEEKHRIESSPRFFCLACRRCRLPVFAARIGLLVMESGYFDKRSVKNSQISRKIASVALQLDRI